MEFNSADILGKNEGINNETCEVYRYLFPSIYLINYKLTNKCKENK
jgi:hypothetical protein